MTRPRSLPSRGPRAAGRIRPAVSIVLPTYNRAPLIGRAIRSVLAQSYGDFELIVVDDGSTDATMDRVTRFRDRRQRRIRLGKNRGAGAARNAGIRAARGSFLAFQDSDDEWLPSKLERHMRVFARGESDVGVVYSDMRRIRSDGTREYHHSPAVVRGVLIDPATRFYQVCKIGIQAAVIRRECLDTVGGFNEAFPALEDLELFIRLSRRYAFHHLRLPLVRYYETDGLSQDMPAKIVARTLLVELYGDALKGESASFLLDESRALGLAASRRVSAARHG